MADSAEKTALAALTLNVVRTVGKLNKALLTEASPKRDKQMRQLLTELEVWNDEAMRNGLHLTPQHIARVKTGRVRTAPEPSVDQKRGNDHTALMRFHFDHIKGPIADGGAQGAALKWLLESFSPEALKAEYELQLTEKWRGRVSWLSVKTDIGKRKEHGQSNRSTDSNSTFEFTPESRIS